MEKANDDGLGVEKKYNITFNFNPYPYFEDTELTKIEGDQGDEDGKGEGSDEDDDEQDDNEEESDKGWSSTQCIYIRLCDLVKNKKIITHFMSKRIF